MRQRFEPAGDAATLLVNLCELPGRDLAAALLQADGFQTREIQRGLGVLTHVRWRGVGRARIDSLSRKGCSTADSGAGARHSYAFPHAAFPFPRTFRNASAV